MGRLKHAKGSYIATLTWLTNTFTAFTATATGGIWTVGCHEDFECK